MFCAVMLAAVFKNAQVTKAAFSASEAAAAASPRQNNNNNHKTPLLFLCLHNLATQSEWRADLRMSVKRRVQGEQILALFILMQS